ncbi:DNA polymerase I [Geobacter sp. SVR]|uniref:DNA polymerase I n=1 Tax=Geobacter sp. SVR TaxID=2495594 RepID=UPI00143F002B|nr:DNA polymerase I [Geobacter sp. SVR]BCS55255.1 DNA polymerase [Geobacter sp. SVR]GCF86054.1 DNA polymerase [Geobacter sp. SVR]
MSHDNTLYLVDGSSYIYRAYYAIRHLSSPSGHPTNAIYGFVQMLLKLLKDYDPRHVAVVFDAGRATFRHDIYAQYKANRIAMPDDLRAQVGPIREVVRAFDIPTLELEGFEADDIIGALAARFAHNGGRVVVVTGDKDLMQIVTEKVTLLDTMKGTESGIAEVIQRFGVEPARVIDILGLAGDTSDNIPGVPGIGEKTAIKLIQEYGSLDGLLERSHEVKGKCGEKLREFREQALLSRRLATIECSVPVEIALDDLGAREPDQETLNALFKLYGFTSLIKELTGRSTLSSDNYRTITTPDELEELVTALEQCGEFALDLETTALDPRLAEIVGFSFSWQEHEACYLPVGHVTGPCPTPSGPLQDPHTVRRAQAPLFAALDHASDSVTSPTEHCTMQPGQLPRAMVLERLRPLLENPALRKVGQNIKFDLQVLATHGISLAGTWFDTMLASYLLNPARQTHGMDALSIEHLGHKMISYSEVTGSGKEQKNFSQVEIEAASRYACEDADVTWLLRRKFEPLLNQGGLETLFHTVEMPLVTILGEMEQHGVLLDTRMLASLSTTFETRLCELEKHIFELAGSPFNINSPKQLGEVLFERLGLKTGKKTKGKTGWSTDNEVLTALAEEAEIARLILDYRGVAKLKSTYSDALPRMVNPRTGRVHTSYNQTITNTGRLSSSDPNLQNIPIRSEEGRMIRHAFIAPPGHVILAADYSQIELRVLAHLSEDQVFCHAFAHDEDIHTRTAAEVFGLFPEMVTSEMRRQAKTINFGIIYGQGAFSLAKQLGVARKTAEEFIAAYKERHHGAIDFLESCIRQAQETGCVHTILGRRLPIPEISSSNGNIRAFAQRNAINYPIQGSAADIIKAAMIRVAARIRAEELKSRLIMQVHDELVFEVPQEELVQMELLVEEEMSRAVTLRVPLKVDISHGSNWSEAH